MRTRLRDIAEEAGVSIITVSRCFKNPQRVSEDTRVRVLQIAARMNYIADNLASSLVSSSRTKTVAVILPTISNPIHAETLQGLTDVLAPAGYQVLVGDDGYSMEREAELVRVFLGYRVSGLVLTGLSHTDDCVAMIRQSGIPVVETLDIIAEPLDMVVGFSNYEAARAISHHLLNTGRRRIAFIGHAMVSDSRSAARQAGFLSAMAECPGAVALVENIPSTTDEREARQALERILSKAPDTDAILFVGHLAAAAALHHAYDLGVAVPGRVAIAAMGDSPVSSWVRPSLTTVQFPQRSIGTTAANMLLTRFQNETVFEKVVDLGYSITVRESA